MNMTIEDMVEYRKNAINILKKNDQHATAKAVEEAFSALICLGQIQWERDVAISQLEDLGIGFARKTDDMVVIEKEKYEDLLEYKAMYEDLCR